MLALSEAGDLLISFELVSTYFANQDTRSLARIFLKYQFGLHGPVLLVD